MSTLGFHVPHNFIIQHRIRAQNLKLNLNGSNFCRCYHYHDKSLSVGVFCSSDATTKFKFWKSTTADHTEKFAGTSTESLRKIIHLFISYHIKETSQRKITGIVKFLFDLS